MIAERICTNSLRERTPIGQKVWFLPGRRLRFILFPLLGFINNRLCIERPLEAAIHGHNHRLHPEEFIRWRLGPGFRLLLRRCYRRGGSRLGLGGFPEGGPGSSLGRFLSQVHLRKVSSLEYRIYWISITVRYRYPLSVNPVISVVREGNLTPTTVLCIAIQIRIVPKKLQRIRYGMFKWRKKTLGRKNPRSLRRNGQKNSYNFENWLRYSSRQQVPSKTPIKNKNIVELERKGPKQFLEQLKMPWSAPTFRTSPTLRYCNWQERCGYQPG